MLLMLGGAPRAGKGIISRQLVRKTAMPSLSLDMLKMGLHLAVPSMGVDPSAPSVDVAEKMWPLVRAMAENALDSNIEYIFEGDMILPKHTAELRAFGGEEVRCCFVGYLKIKPRQKLAEIRRNAGYPNDWLNEHNDEEVLGLIEYGIEFSRYLSEECERLGSRYFDSSTDFEGTVQAAVTYLMPPG